MVETDKYIEVADRNFVTEKKGEVQIKIHENSSKPFISTFYNVLFAQDL